MSVKNDRPRGFRGTAGTCSAKGCLKATGDTDLFGPVFAIDCDIFGKKKLLVAGQAFSPVAGGKRLKLSGAPIVEGLQGRLSEEELKRAIFNQSR